MTRLRNYFLTGLVVAGPVAITLYLTWSLVSWVDSWVKPYLPSAYNPDTYLPFPVPGFGLVVGVVVLMVIGFLTANIVGSTLLGWSERMLNRMPVVRNLYRGLKQIFETVLAERGSSFQTAVLLEYPRRGLWTIGFVAGPTRGETRRRLPFDEEAVTVFVPTTPNPTGGFLLFLPLREVVPLDMSVEDAAKLVISFGLVSADTGPAAKKRFEKAAERMLEKV